MKLSSKSDVFNFLSDIADQAKRAGADDASVTFGRQSGININIRLGAVESLESPSASSLTIKVFVGDKQGQISPGNIKPETIKTAIDDVIRDAKSNSDDPHSRLAEPELLSKKYPKMPAAERGLPDTDRLIALAKTAEGAARARDLIVNSDGAGVGWERAEHYILATNGFKGHAVTTGYGLSVSVISQKGDRMETGSAYTQAYTIDEMESPESMGADAAQRAIQKLDTQPIKTCRVPVIFDPRAGRSLLNHFANAINGGAIVKGTTFLTKADLKQQLFNKSVTIIDDPLMPRGLASRAFDSTGIAARRVVFADKGVLQTWLMSLRSARKLGMSPLGHSGGVSNFYMENGTLTPEDLSRDEEGCFYVTDLMGSGVNGTTGDYSRAAGGLWLKNGEVVHAVQDVTLVGNLRDMFRNITPANDLNTRKSSIAVPTLRIDGMTLAAK